MFENESFIDKLKQNDVVMAVLDCINGRFTVLSPQQYQRKYISQANEKLPISGNSWRFFLAFYGSVYQIKMLKDG